MATWIIIAALATIGVTALLIGVLHRINAPAGTKQRRDSGEGGVFIDAGGDSDGGGGDGGGD